MDLIPRERTALTIGSTLVEIWTAAEPWIADQVSPATMDGYRSVWRCRIEPLLGELRLSELAAGSRLDRWLEQIRRGTGTTRAYSAPSTKQCKAVMTHIMEYCRLEELITENPIRKVRRIRTTVAERLDTRNRLRALTRAEFITYLQAVDHDQEIRADKKYRCDLGDVIRGYFMTGVRTAELLALRFGDINATADELVIEDLVVPPGCLAITGELVRSKGQPLTRTHCKTFESHRVIEMPEPLRLLIARRVPYGLGDRVGEYPVFPSAVGGWWSPNNLRARIREMHERILTHARENGIAPPRIVTPKAGRKFVATELSRSGLTAPEIAGVMGHSTYRTTERYYIGRLGANSAAARVLTELVNR